MHKIYFFIFILSLCACKSYPIQKQDSSFYLQKLNVKKISLYAIKALNDTFLKSVSIVQDNSEYSTFLSPESTLLFYTHTHSYQNVFTHTKYDSSNQRVSSIFILYDKKGRVIEEKYENSIFTKLDYTNHIFTKYERVNRKKTLQISKQITKNKDAIVRIDSTTSQKPAKHKVLKTTFSYQITPSKDSLISVCVDTFFYKKNQIIEISNTQTNNSQTIFQNTHIKIYGVNKLNKYFEKHPIHELSNAENTTITIFNSKKDIIYKNINNIYEYIYEYTYNHKGDWVTKHTYKIELDKKYLEESLWRVIEY